MARRTRPHPRGVEAGPGAGPRQSADEPERQGIPRQGDRLGSDADRGLLLLYTLTPQRGKAAGDPHRARLGQTDHGLRHSAFPSGRNGIRVEYDVNLLTGCGNMACPSDEFLMAVGAHQRDAGAQLAGHRPAVRRAASASGRAALAG